MVSGGKAGGGRRPRPSGHRTRAAFALLLLLAMLLAPVAGRAEPLDIVGRAPGVPREGDAVMQPVHTPARMARVAVVPGTGGDEAWGFGFTDAPIPGYETFWTQGRPVFMRYRRATGWQVFGPPVDRAGLPALAQLSSLSIAPGGEGWAVGFTGAIFHYRPGDTAWREHLDSGLTGNVLYSVSVGRDARGVFGYAVGQNLTFLRLADGRWTREQATGAVSQNNAAVPELGAVATVSREIAWAVSNYSSQRVLIFERSAGAWTQRPTGRPMFDTPPAPVADPGGEVTVNRYATGAGIAADARTVWVTGEMQPVNPADRSSPDDSSRPFALRYDIAREAFTSFCPPIYRLETGGVSSRVEVCDRSFPFATRNLPFVQITGGEAVAGGFGFFRFRGGRWQREPNSVGYIVAGSFADGDEGWVATSGDIFAGGAGVAVTTAWTVGHWTRRPEQPRTSRWPIAARAPLEAIARHPGGDGLLAVGQGGLIARLDPGVGWDTVRSPTDASLHAIAWPAREAAWAVGAAGTIIRYDGRRWTEDPASGRATTKSLYGVAFRAPDDGVAVGVLGTILRYDGTRWRRDPASERLVTKSLNAVVAAGRQFVAVGDKRSMLIHDGGRWRLVDDLVDTLEERPQNLLAAAALPDGSVFTAGASSVVLERSGYGPFRVSQRPPLGGTVLALAAARAPSGRVRLLASVGTGSNNVRYFSDRLADASGWLMAGDDRGWRDLTLGHARAISPSSDAPAMKDPAYAVLLDPDARSGWAAGGYPENVSDSDGHSRASSSSSIWRVGIDAPPSPSPSVAEAVPPVPLDGVSFAFLGDSACAEGLCGDSMGTGARSDAVLSHALSAIERAAPLGVRFVAYGGDMRRNGMPDELASIESAFARLRIPVYAALGDKDLFAGVGSVADDQQGGLLPSNGYYLSVFADRPQPWGRGAAPESFTPVGAPNNSNRARTHYAVDYRPPGAVRPQARLIFLDTSQVPLAQSAPFQNPQEDQLAWLREVLDDGRRSGIPSAVVMHQPVVPPISVAPDAASIGGILTATGATLGLASHVGVNRLVQTPSDAVPDAVPFGVFGGAGAPLANGWRPERGAYHAWQLVTMRPDGPPSIASIPILESAALHAERGRSAAAGTTLSFSALLRLPDVGGANANGASSDVDEGFAGAIAVPLPDTCGLLQEPARDRCFPTDAVPPQFRFTTDDPSIAAFVREDPDRPGIPFRDAGGNLVADDQHGLLCTFAAGKTHVRVESGFVATRMPVGVAAGSGPCIPGRVVQPVDPQVLAERSLPEPQIPDELVPQALARFPQAPAIVALPVPPINPVPAPPGAPGVGRKEEREVSTESEGHGANHFIAAERRAVDLGAMRWWLLAVLGMGALAGATGVAAARRATPAPVQLRRDP